MFTVLIQCNCSTNRITESPKIRDRVIVMKNTSLCKGKYNCRRGYVNIDGMRGLGL